MLRRGLHEPNFMEPNFVDWIIEFYHKPRIDQNQNKLRAVLVTQRAEREKLP